MRRGRFIAMEGIDGSGTTTQAKLLAERLRADGRTVEVTAQPTRRMIGSIIRANLHPEATTTPEEMALLFAADRLEHLRGCVVPLLEGGCDVICDRYVLSSLAYQGMHCPQDWVRTLNRYARPADLTLFLDVPVDMARRRVESRGGEKERFDDDELQRRIDRTYRIALWRQEQDMNINGASPDAPKTVVVAGDHAIDIVAESIYVETRKIL